MVKTIELTQGQHALVDDCDYDYLNQWKWHALHQPTINGFYACRNMNLGYKNGKQKHKAIRMHRTIIESVIGRELQRNEFVDHINHNPLDNRRENLRIASIRQNAQNLKRKTTSKYPGVCWHKEKQKWIAQIQLKGNKKHLGTFNDEIQAAKVYEQACRELVGEELICKIHKRKEVI